MRFNADDVPPKNGKAACVGVSKDANPNSSRVGMVKGAVSKDFLSKITGSGMQDLELGICVVWDLRWVMFKDYDFGICDKKSEVQDLNFRLGI